MIKVITYGTYDVIHKGHIRLLERAKALGDYLIVGVTADSFDRERGKINVQQSLIERVEAVRATGLADEIIVEEYEGQKIDDIKRLGIDIFTVGSDWEGHFDYLKEFCKVVYLERTQGISSSEIRAEKRDMKIGLVGESPILNKIERESQYVNGLSISGVYSRDTTCFSPELKKLTNYNSIEKLLENSDGVYIISSPKHHYDDIKSALSKGKHVLCESPITICEDKLAELYAIAESNNCILMDSIKTAYSLAYYRLCLLAKSGIIGKIISVDATCTSLYNVEIDNDGMLANIWNSVCAWGPTALLPVFQLLGTDYSSKTIATHLLREDLDYDTFTKISLIYPHAVASIKVGQGVKSEGELIISGTKGYIYVPAPWWKTDYFEVRYENPADNKRHFYPLEGEGIRYELVSFLKSISSGNKYSYIDKSISRAIVTIIQDFYERKDTVLL
ncbi:MAG: adenylyltransferase/cytidyltransferase family protein [Prevotella sp.]|jgi:choline-phosphate cytidylyltransferase|nr:adenylyltransferase/cytidyltransferase family protein [Prevotella sp.]MBP9982345.1 adenylyltransferase/cytidyltransferase family protein [Prevotella sp.]